MKRETDPGSRHDLGTSRNAIMDLARLVSGIENHQCERILIKTKPYLSAFMCAVSSWVFLPQFEVVRSPSKAHLAMRDIWLDAVSRQVSVRPQR